MLKRVGLPVIAMLAALAVAHPTPARAGVGVGVYIGGGPVYTAPVAPYPYTAPVPAPYVDPYAYPQPYAYPAPAPVYVAPPYVPSYGYARPIYRDRGYDRRYEHNNYYRGNNRGYGRRW